MNKVSIEALARQLMTTARDADSGRAASTVFGGHEHAMRQTLVAVRAGCRLDHHENPGEATVYVVTGRVRLTAGADQWEGRTGDLIIVPQGRHGLDAIEDSAVLLSAVPRAHIS